MTTFQDHQVVVLRCSQPSREKFKQFPSNPLALHVAQMNRYSTLWQPHASRGKRRAHVPWPACQQPMRALAAARAILQSSQLDRGQDLSRNCHMFGECKNHRIANPVSFAKSRLANYKCKNVKMSFFQKHVVLTLFRSQQSQTWTQTINQLMKS